MINANELRIGNKFIGIAGKQTVLSIIDNTDNGKIEYKSEHHKLMYSHLILCKENGNQYKPCEIEGVQLTPEILEKAGFTTNSDEQSIYFLEYKIHNGWVLQWYQNGSTYYKYEEIECEMSHVKYEYVHQIQNLYFALTGEELIIEL